MHRNLFSAVRVALVLAILSVMAAPGRATNPFVNQLYGTNMVLQRDANDPIWGWVAAGTMVTVVVKDQNATTIQTKTAVADSTGLWQTTIGPFGLVAGNAAYSIVVSASGQTTKTFTNVLIGDVWLCSGQSNMEWTLNKATNGAAAITTAQTYANIRECDVGTTYNVGAPQDVFASFTAWQTTAGASGFPAVGWFAAKEMYDQTGVPIGIFSSSQGGTGIQFWIPKDYFRNIAEFTTVIDSNANPSYATLYNSMIAPATRLRIKGVIWYQGESNVRSYLNGYPDEYPTAGGPRYGALFNQLRAGWRSKFGQPNLPFVIVQLCTYGAAPTAPVVGIDNWPDVREAELNVATGDAYTRLVVTMDTGDTATTSANVHPANKQDPGKRAGQAALQVTGQLPTAYLSPTFNHASVSGGTIRCYFDNVGAGLMVGAKSGLNAVTDIVGGTLTQFAIAGANGTFYAATATIDAATNTVVVSSPSVPAPVAVRYGWNNNPVTTSGTINPTCNLYRRLTNAGGATVDGVPVSPFRSDPVAQLTVVGGSGSGVPLAPGSVQTIVAAAAPSGQAFAHWSGDTSLVADPNSAGTTVTMSKTYVSLLANYTLNAAPSGLAASTSVDHQVSLTWTAVPNAYAYNVKRATSSGGPYVTVAGQVAANACVDAGVPYGNYFYKVSALSEVNESPDTAPLAITLCPVASNLTATATSAQIALAWTAPAVPVVSYNVKRGTNPAGPFATLQNVGSGTLAYTDTTAAGGVVYYYTVSVVDSSGEYANAPAVAAALTGLPAGWTAQDVGSVPGVGGTTYNAAANTGTFALVGYGADIWNSADAFHFASQTLAGDGTIIARVASNSGGKIGLMMRKDATAGAAYYDLLFQATTPKSEYRATAGAAAASVTGSGAAVAFPYWLKLVRAGTTFTGYTSPDGVAWSQFGQKTVASLSGVVLAGLVKCANSASASSTGAFDHVSISTPVTAPDSLAAAALSDTQLLLTWANHATNATAIQVERSVTGSGAWTTLAAALSAGADSYQDNTAVADETYDYRVSALNAGYVSGYANISISMPPAVGDGIPGSWRYQYFGDGTAVIPGLSGATDNPDGDELNNLQEYLAGTDPLSSASTLRASLALVASNLVVSFPSVTGKNYVVERSTDLATGSWATVGQTPVSGTGGAVSVTDAGAGALPRVFYRVRLVP